MDFSPSAPLVEMKNPGLVTVLDFFSPRDRESELFFGGGDGKMKLAGQALEKCVGRASVQKLIIALPTSFLFLYSPPPLLHLSY